MKRLILAAAAAAVMAVSCGCNKDDSKGDSSSGKKNVPDSSFVELEPDIASSDPEIEVTENTFDWLENCSWQADDFSSFMATASCENSAGLPEGSYSSPEVTAKVNGQPCAEASAYLTVTDSTIIMNVSFSGCYVLKDSDIEMTVKDFNSLNTQEDETIDYSDISDETVFEGTVSLKSKAVENFGYLLFLPEQSLGIEQITLGVNSVTLTKCQDIFSSGEPTADVLSVELADGSVVTYDVCTIVPEYDEEDEPTGRYDAIFSFSDMEKVIAPEQVKSVSVNGKTVAEN